MELSFIVALVCQTFSSLWSISTFTLNIGTDLLLYKSITYNLLNYNKKDGGAALPLAYVCQMLSSASLLFSFCF